MARVLPLRRAAALRRAGASGGATRSSPGAAGRKRGGCGRTSRSTRGTGSGTGARSSTTARRSARRPTTSARSIPCPRAGPCSRGRRIRRGRGRRWTASSGGSCGASERLIQLFDPPFDTSALEPGYIKGYVPGVRENGGQYTHAAIWAVMAFAELGDTERAWELFSLLNPINHAGHAGGGRGVQGRAVRRGGRRLRAASAHRPRRLDVVHRFGGLDVPADRRDASRAAAGGGQAAA